MAVQSNSDNSSVPFIRFANPAVIDEEAVLSQDAGRSAVLASKTLMAKIAATQKWEPFTDETATDGTAIPQGIYVGPDIPAADLVAGGRRGGYKSKCRVRGSRRDGMCGV